MIWPFSRNRWPSSVPSVILRADEVCHGQEVLTLNGWKKVSKVKRLDSNGICLEYAEGGVRYAHRDEPVLTRG